MEAFATVMVEFQFYKRVTKRIFYGKLFLKQDERVFMFY